MKPRILFLIGPTGSGKSELAIRLAKSLNGEIVSCDAMLIYKKLDIGTAKPTRKERNGIRHHLMDVLPRGRSFTVSRYRKMALKAIAAILKRKKLPVIVGGSGLYISALIKGLPSQGESTANARKKLERELSENGVKALYERLQKIDPDRAKDILPSDGRRTIRALEIYETLGEKPSVWMTKRIGLKELGYQWTAFGLRRDRHELYERVNQRVDQMMKRGFLNEVKMLKKGRFSKTAFHAIGYRELSDYLDEKITLEQAIQDTKKRTRHLAKKQLTWFRKESEIHWISVKGNNLNSAKSEILKYWKER